MAALTTLVLVSVTTGLLRLPGSASPAGSTSIGLGRGRPAPAIAGTSIDGRPVDLAALRGRPVIVNFWGPNCVPCRDEFPLFRDKLSQHAADGLAIVGVLMYDPPGPARQFIEHYGATWPTIDDPMGSIRAAYRVAARPQSYFIDRDGILRAIQVGQLTDAEFERQYAQISGSQISGSAVPS